MKHESRSVTGFFESMHLFDRCGFLIYIFAVLGGAMPYAVEETQNSGLADCRLIFFRFKSLE